MGTTDAVSKPVPVLLVLFPDNSHDIKRIKQSNWKWLLINHVLSLDLCRAVHSKIDFRICRKIFGWRENVHQACIEEHRHKFECPDGPFASVDDGVEKIEECGGAEGISKKLVGGVEYIHYKFEFWLGDRCSSRSVVK